MAVQSNLARLHQNQPAGLGANGNDVTVVTGYAKFADVDIGRPLVQQLGAAEAAKINAKLLAIRTIIEVVTRRRVSDLSF
jgi:hypothetical protein